MARSSQPNLHSSSLLSPSHYDEDAFPVHSDKEIESEDDEAILQTQAREEVSEHDRSILLDEDEREEILRQNSRTNNNRGLTGPLKSIVGKAYAALPVASERRHDSEEASEKFGDGRRNRRRQRRARRKEKKDRLQSDAEQGEARELMYEMEEGGMKGGSSTGSSSETEDSSVLDRRELRQLADEKTRRRQKWQRFCLIHLFIALGFMMLVVGAWKLSANRKRVHGQLLFNNGTALFAPTTILISLDGFRADFLDRGLTPRLNAFIKEGVSPLHMLPSFPSVTFPNHYTLVTGLYPESHGIVGNTFWDPDLKSEFYYTDPDRSMQGHWWGGEPLWVTAERQGIRTAIHMWPGSEAHIMGVEPSFMDVYNGKELLSKKVDRILELVDKPGEEDRSAETSSMRPQLIAAYVPNVDTDGHSYGPNSTEIRTTINEVDKMLDQLFAGLEERNLTEVVNVVVVSDHGMATTSVDRLIQLEDLVDLSLIEHTDGWPLYGLRPKNPEDLQSLFQKLTADAAAGLKFDVYLRDFNMPERYHFSNNPRIAPLWIVPKTGWAIVTKDEFDVQIGKEKGSVFHPRGLHGYDHEHPLMRAIFVARGPSFPHPPNSRIEVFQNTEVYNVICDTLGLTPKPNNGTIRLPFKPLGLHSSETAVPEVEDPVKPTTTVELTHTVKPGTDAISISPIEASSAADPNVAPPVMVGVNPVEEVPERPVVGDGGNHSDEGKGHENLWDYFVGKLEDFKEWFGDLVDGQKPKESQDGE